MKDDALTDLCKTIYRNHKTAIGTIVELGGSSEFERLADEILRENEEFEILALNSRSVWFIPTAWKNLIPENGVAWPRLARPISVACWMDKQDDDKVRLIFEVSAMTDPALRLSFVTRLRSAGFKLGAKAFNNTATFSRFFRCKHAVADMGDEEEIREAINDVLAKGRGQFPKVEGVIRDTFTTGKKDLK